MRSLQLILYSNNKPLLAGLIARFISSIEETSEDACRLFVVVDFDGISKSNDVDGIAACRGGRRSHEECAENQPLQVKAHAPNWSTAFWHPDALVHALCRGKLSV
eukprot:scaffold9494_cov84-Cylindrotheca_fusiformis.AAC.3